MITAEEARDALDTAILAKIEQKILKAITQDKTSITFKIKSVRDSVLETLRLKGYLYSYSHNYMTITWDLKK